MIMLGFEVCLVIGTFIHCYWERMQVLNFWEDVIKRLKTIFMPFDSIMSFLIILENNFLKKKFYNSDIYNNEFFHN